MEPPWVVGIQRNAFFQDGQPLLPLAIQRQEPAEKPDDSGSVGVEGQGSFSLRSGTTPAHCGRNAHGPGQPGRSGSPVPGPPLFGPRPGPVPGVTPWGIIAASSFAHRGMPTSSRRNRTPAPASRPAPEHSKSRQKSGGSRWWHGGRTAGRPHRSREIPGASGGTSRDRVCRMMP